MSEREREAPRALREDELEALAHGRRDLAGEDAVRAVEDDEALAAWVEREREGSREASVALKRAAPELEDLDAMIASAMAKAPEGAVEGSTPSRASLWIGAALGALVALASGVASVLVTSGPEGLAREAWADLGAIARLGVTLATTMDRLVALVPGGWGAVAAIGLALFVVLALPLRAMAGPWARAPRDAGTAAAIALAVLVSAAGGTARAYEVEGAWPEVDARVSVDVDRAPRSEALRQALASGGLGLAYTLDEDPPVTLHVREAPLREVLDAVLGDAPARVRHTGHLVVVRESVTRTESVTESESGTGTGTGSGSGTGAGSGTGSGSATGTGTGAGNAVGNAPPLPPPPPAVPIAAGAGPELRDLVTFGGDARVLPEQRVRDVITMGGDALVEGQAYGNVVTMGGDADVRGTVVGDVVTMGGDIRVAESGRVHGQLNAMGGDVDVATRRDGSRGVQVAVGSMELPGAAERERDDDGRGWIGETFDAAMRHALLFLLGLLFLGLAPDRLRTLQGTIVKQPLRTLASGFLGAIAGAVLTVVLVITIIGIPAAIVLALGLFLGSYLGLASTASVIGAALPIAALKDRPVLQLGAGVVVLFVISRVPVIGTLLVIGATLSGLGSVILTRLGSKPLTGIAANL